MRIPGPMTADSPFYPGIRARARILVAEDDEEMRTLIVEALRKDGHDVSCVPDGGRLLVKLARERYGAEGAEGVDLLVSDVQMPVCTGLQILQQLRAVRCGIPVILVTAFRDDQTRNQARSLGAELLTKPFELEHLRATVSKLLLG